MTGEAWIQLRLSALPKGCRQKIPLFKLENSFALPVSCKVYGVFIHAFISFRGTTVHL